MSTTPVASETATLTSYFSWTNIIDSQDVALVCLRHQETSNGAEGLKAVDRKLYIK